MEPTLTDHPIFEQVLADHGGMLWRATAIYEMDLHLRQDLYQEILLAVWRALPRLRDSTNLRTYLARIAHNRGVSHIERQVRLPEVSAMSADELGSPHPGPEGQMEMADRRARLLAAVQRLPVSWQQVVTLTLEDFAPREVADVLGLPVNVVSIRLTRAKAALRDLMKEDGHGNG